MDEIKKALAEFKDQIMAKVAEDTDNSSKAMREASEKLELKIKELEDAVKERKVSMPGVEKEKFSYARALRAILQEKKYGEKAWDNAKYEREVFFATEEEYGDRRRAAQPQHKSVNTVTDVAGGYLVPEEISSEVIDLAMANVVIVQLGATILRDLVGDLAIPKLSTRPTTYWVGEEEAPTESDTTFGMEKMSPKTIGAFTKISQMALHQSNRVADQLVRGALADAFALGLDDGYMNGKGTDNEPEGILQNGSIGTTITDFSTNDPVTRDLLGRMIDEVENNDRLRDGGRFGFLMRPKQRSAVKRERIANYSGQTDGNYAFVSLSNQELEDIIGYPILTSTQVPVTSAKAPVLFGDWARFFIGMWGGFELKASDVAGNSGGSAMLQRQIWITAFQSVDTVVTAANAFIKAPDAKATI